MVKAVETGVEANLSASISATMLVAERCFIVLATRIVSVHVFECLNRRRDPIEAVFTYRSKQHLHLLILQDQKGLQERYELLRASRRC